jgi:hypothetical protein
MGDNDEAIRRAQAVLEASRSATTRSPLGALTLANVYGQVDPFEGRLVAEAQVLAVASGDPCAGGRHAPGGGVDLPLSGRAR